MISLKYKLIANPGAGRGRSREVVQRTLEAFRKKGLDFDLEFTKGPRDAERIARKAVGEFDVIVAVGGDGTINETIPGMIFSDKPLGIVPGGSGNDFIKVLNIPNNIERAVDIIASGKTRIIDAGRINGTWFANGVGFGFDAAVNRASYGINHSKRGFFLYLCALFQTLGKYDPVPIRVSMNGETISENIFLLTIGNGTTFGGGFRLTPHAVIDDGLLNVTMVKALGIGRLLWHLPKVFLGTIDRVKRYALLARTNKITVESAGTVPIHVDGEIYGEQGTRFEIEAMPGALRVICNF
jgi:YegS/Rv2252/BmrU family lipid kinase